MSFYDAFKDVLSVAQKSDNIDIYRKVLDLSAQAQELQNENNQLRAENEELKRIKNLEERIIRHEDTYITLSDDESNTMYCSRCWDAERKLVQVRCSENGYFHCVNCKNSGAFDKTKVRHSSRQQIIY